MVISEFEMEHKHKLKSKSKSMLVLSNNVFHGHIPNFYENRLWIITRKTIICFAWCFNNISITYGHRRWQESWNGMEWWLERREERESDILTYNKEEKRLQLNHLATQSSLFPSIFFSWLTHTHTRILTHTHTDQSHTNDGIAPKENRVVCTIQLSVRGE